MGTDQNLLAGREGPWNHVIWAEFLDNNFISGESAAVPSWVPPGLVPNSAWETRPPTPFPKISS